MKNTFGRTLGACAVFAFCGSAAQAGSTELLLVDLSTPDQITITATGGLSLVTTSGTNLTGFYLADFFTAGNSGVVDSLVSGNLTSAENPSDGSPDLFGIAGNVGLNVWSVSTDSTLTFTAGSTAFSGSATWDVDSITYAEMIASGVGYTGDIYFPADSDDDLSSAQILGTYRVVPTPGAAAVIAGAGLVTLRRRR